MDTITKNRVYSPEGRITLADFFRGFTMLVLIIENARLISQIRSVKESSILQFIATQFSHIR